MATIKMRPSEVSKCLEVAISENHPMMLSGPPGVGKTELVVQAAENVGAKLIISHPVVSDPTDYKGLPWVDSSVGHPVARFLPFSDLYRLVEAKGTTVFLLDDLGQAPPTVQAAAMQLILGRRINEIEVSDAVVFFACTNRREDKAGVQGILEPVKSRFFTIVEVDTDVEDWAKWAIKKGLPFDIINLMRWKPELLLNPKPSMVDMKNTPSPRTVYHAAKLIMAKYPEDLLPLMVAGAAGEAWMTEWQAWKRIQDQIPNVDKILNNPEKGDIPSEAHIMYALCGALAERANTRTFEAIVRYANRISKESVDSKGKKASGKPEFSIMMIKDCLLKDPRIAKSKEYIDWQLAHKDVIM